MFAEMNGEGKSNGGEARRDAYAAFRFRDFRLLLAGSLLANTGRNMLSVAIGWELYERTGSAMALGWVGLIQGLPIILLSMPAGHLADRVERRLIVSFTEIILAVVSFSLAFVSLRQGPVAWMYALLLANSIAHAFNGAASSSLLPLTVPEKIFSNAITWKSSSFQVASVAGPALGGMMIAMFKGAAGVYLTNGIASLLYASFVFMISHKPVARVAEEVTLKTLAAGFRFVWQTKIILATITLDLFAVLLGGAVMLLPIYAKDILHVGPHGLGWMRAAPAAGAFVMAFAMAHMPPSRQIGKLLLWAVAGFGVATIIFGVSQWYWLSLLMLALTGAFDNISVVVRHSLVQLRTPDAMRGRVSAVNNVFISSSNELGAFESGLVAAWFGAVFSVVSGGIGTILVVLLTAKIWPEIRNLKSLHDHDT